VVSRGVSPNTMGDRFGQKIASTGGDGKREVRKHNILSEETGDHMI